jgi:hypothetical protein
MKRVKTYLCNTLLRSQISCESIASEKKILHRKKFGFFQSEKEIFEQIAEHTSMKQFSEQPRIYLRHPFVWLVEPLTIFAIILPIWKTPIVWG